MPFQKGQSGNPRGRPPGGTSLAERIREKGGDDGGFYVDLLHDIATDRKESTRHRLDAVKILLERGYGSPPQEIHVEPQRICTADDIREELRAEGLLGLRTKSELEDEERETEAVISAWLSRE